MFQAKQEDDEIIQQGKELEHASMIEKTIDQLGVVIKECKQVETQAEENEKEQHDAQLRQKRYEMEMQFKKAKLEQKLTFENKTEEKKQQDINTKLPKEDKEHTC